MPPSQSSLTVTTSAFDLGLGALGVAKVRRRRCSAPQMQAPLVPPKPVR
jgi:hypothetical protein